MKHLAKWVGLILGICFLGLGQVPIQNWSVGLPPMANIIGTTYNNSSNSGTSLWYWVTSNYVAGSVLNYNPASVGGVTSGDPAPGSSITISFNSVNGPTTYSVLRTSTATPPSFPCSCLVGSVSDGVGQVVDTGSALQAFSPTLIKPVVGDIRLNNTGYAVPTFEYTINGVTSPLAPIQSIEQLNFYKDDTSIVGTGANNTLAINTDRTTPNVITQVVDSATVANNTGLVEAYLYNTSIGLNSLPPGNWVANIYATVNSVAGGRVSTITDTFFTVMPYLDTITTTGTGAARTATATSGAPFCLTCIVASSNPLLASYLQTPQGLYQISVRTSDVAVTIITPTTYTNEAPGASYSVWNKVFGATTVPIVVNANYPLYQVITALPAIPVVPVMKVGEIMMVTSNNTTTISYTHNGTAHYSNLQTPIQ